MAPPIIVNYFDQKQGVYGAFATPPTFKLVYSLIETKEAGLFH